MVTTESRTEATTSVSSGALGAVVAPATVTAAGAPGAVDDGANGPATSAAVPPAASTADRTAARTTAVGPRREPPVRRGKAALGAWVEPEVSAVFGAGFQAGASVGAGAQASVCAGV